ncbi:SGNH/GDSL hydrolase family protein [Streptomyces europaeiscabiei]
MTAPPPYRRYVAIGDSMTEGLGDPDPAGGHRGWADRLAEALAGQEPSLAYANLAVRGRTAAQIRAEQLRPALELRPDLVTVMAGMNDLVRSGFDAASVIADIDEMFARLTESGARVATVTFPDLGKVSPLARRVLPRILDLNTRLRATAERHGVLVLDVFAHLVTTDPRLWADDRLHASPLGHARIASGMAHTLGLLVELLTVIGGTLREGERDLLALKAVGLSPRQITAITVTATGCTALAAIGVALALGIPLAHWLIDAQGRSSGIGAGIAHGPSPLALSAFGAASVLGALALAALPAARTSRHRLADTLSAVT